MIMNFKEWNISESESSQIIDKLCHSFVSSAKDKDKELLGIYHGIKVYIVDRAKLQVKYPEWRFYLGSHHWGKKTDYIPEDEVWVASDNTKSEFRRILNHELIEREAMRALEEEKGMSKDNAWVMAHMWVKQMGF
jgi:hypothetical protein